MVRETTWRMKSVLLVVLISVGLIRPDDVAPTTDEHYVYIEGELRDRTVCECPPYSKCANTDIKLPGGEDLINIRFGGENLEEICSEEVKVCCQVPDQEENQIEEEEFSCGRRNDEQISIRIFSDSENEADVNEFPWMIALLRRERRGDGTITYNYKCGGSLIHPSVVLTAAHCVYRKDPELYKVVAGDWNLNNNEEPMPSEERSLVRVVIHHEFNWRGLLNDVALLETNKPFKQAPHIDTICLPAPNSWISDSNCLAAGWGRDAIDRKGGQLQQVMKKVELPLVPIDNCNKALRRHPSLGPAFQLHESFICAGGKPGRDTCQGDGGSPLVCPIPGTDRYQQVGIVAWGIGCGTKYPGVYVNVAHFWDWIDQNMAEMHMAQTYLFNGNSTSPQ